MVPKKKRKIDWSDQSFTGLGLIVRTASNWKNTSSGKKGYKNEKWGSIPPKMLYSSA